MQFKEQLTILKAQHKFIMKKFFYSIAGIFVTLSVPLFVWAAGAPTSPDPSAVCGAITLTTLGNILKWASCTLIKLVVPLLFTIAVVGFIWGMIQYFLFPDNEEKRKNGKSFMLWGIIALFVMVSIWGLVGVLTNTFGIKTLLPQLSQ